MDDNLSDPLCAAARAAVLSALIKASSLHEAVQVDVCRLDRTGHLKLAQDPPCQNLAISQPWPRVG